jgi:hypothetical protein
VASIGSLVIDLLVATGTFETDLDREAKRLKKRVDDIGRDVGKIGKQIAQAGVAAASAFGLMVRSQINAADEFRDLSQATGVSVESLSELEHAAELSGAEMEDITKGFRKLNDAAADSVDPTSKAALAFKQLGVSALNADGTLKDSEQLMLDVADAFSEFEDGAGKAAIAQDLLGKSGARLIPFLNQGRDAIEALKEAARQLGLTISAETAAAADKFNDNLTTLKGGLVALSREAASRLLPTLVGITDQFVAFVADGDEVRSLVDKIEAGFKALVTVGVVLKSLFTIIGGTIGTLAAAASDLGKGLTIADFNSPAILIAKIGKNALESKDSLGRLSQGFGDIADSVGKDMEFIDGLWNGFAETLKEVEVTAKRLKPQLKLLDPGTVKDIADAAKTLEDFRQGLLEQIATFDLGEAAAIKYRLEFGNLSDEVKKAGALGEKIKDGILAAANFKQAQEDAKALGEAIADVNIQLQELAGNNVGAALAAFDKQNAELRKTIARSGSQEDADKLNALRDQIGAQAEFNQLSKDAAAITAELARQEERITNTQLTGATTELDAMGQLDEARKAAVVQLDAIYQKQLQIANASGNKQLQEDAKEFGAQIESLAAQTDLLAQKIRSGFEEAGTDAFASFIDGSKSAGDAFDDFISDIEKQLLALISKQLVQKLFGTLFGTAGGGGDGGFFTALAGFLGSGKAYGGDVMAGTLYPVNEREPEFFKPNVGGKVIPLSKMGSTGGHVTQNINVRGDVSQRSAQQLAVETARRQRVASARLG